MRNRFNGSNVSLALAAAASSAVVTASIKTTAGQSQRGRPGVRVVVDGYQAKDGTKRANDRDLTFPDGTKLFLGSSGAGAPYELRPGQPGR